MKLRFCKYSGCGNDFILIDNRNQMYTFLQKNLIQSLCHRHKGIGGDGVIFLESTPRADLKMRIFNSDGLEAEMCGNGLRCLIQFSEHLGNTKKKYTILTKAGILEGFLTDHGVKTSLPFPGKEIQSKHILVDSTPLLMHFLNTGVPHVVGFSENLEDLDLTTLGPKIRHHPSFAPNGVNVNFAEIHPGTNKISIRTYERGVEQETMACGTGCTATALVASRVYNIESPIYLMTKSGDTLKVDLEPLFLTGSADLIFEGEIELE